MLSCPGASYHVFFSAGEYEAAEQHLLLAKKSDPQQSRIYLQLGELYRALGRNEESAEAFDTFCRLEEKTLPPEQSPEMRAFIEKVRAERDRLRERQ